jgi:predicted transcriptional regulator
MKQEFNEKIDNLKNDVNNIKGEINNINTKIDNVIKLNGLKTK